MEARAGDASAANGGTDAAGRTVETQRQRPACSKSAALKKHRSDPEPPAPHSRCRSAVPQSAGAVTNGEMCSDVPSSAAVAAQVATWEQHRATSYNEATDVHDFGGAEEAHEWLDAADRILAVLAEASTQLRGNSGVAADVARGETMQSGIIDAALQFLQNPRMALEEAHVDGGPAQRRAAAAAVQDGKQQCAHSFVSTFSTLNRFSCAYCKERITHDGRIVAENEKMNTALAEDSTRDNHSHFLWSCGVTVGFLIDFTNRYDCSKWKTWQVHAFIILPSTARTRQRYVDLLHVRASAAVGPADVFISREPNS